MTMQPRPQDLAAIVGLLRTAQHVDAIRLLADAIDRRLSDPEAPSIDASLGLSAPGKAAPARQLSQARRDAALRRYARKHLDAMSARSAAEIIAQALRRYETARWRHDLASGHVPDDGLPSIAHEALAAGLTLPGTEAVRRILAATG